MFVSVFDMFKIGIGPSSSHTMGPMVAANNFLELMRSSPFNFAGVRCRLHGSLAFTGKGHGTDKAIKLGLLNQTPDQFEYNTAQFLLDNLKKTNIIKIENLNPINFNPNTQIIYKNKVRYDMTL